MSMRDHYLKLGWKGRQRVDSFVALMKFMGALFLLGFALSTLRW